MRGEVFIAQGGAANRHSCLSVEVDGANFLHHGPALATFCLQANAHWRDSRERDPALLLSPVLRALILDVQWATTVYKFLVICLYHRCIATIYVLYDVNLFNLVVYLSFLLPFGFGGLVLV